MGLLGALIVLPRDPATSQWAGAATDAVALVHTYGTTTTVNGRIGTTYVTASEGTTARVRFINGDNGPVRSPPLFPSAWPRSTGPTYRSHRPRRHLRRRACRRARRSADRRAPVIGTRRRTRRARSRHRPHRPTGRGGPSTPALRCPGLRRQWRIRGGAGHDRQADTRLRVPHRVENRIPRRTSRVWFTINAGSSPRCPCSWHTVVTFSDSGSSNTTAVVHPMHRGHHALVVARNGVAATVHRGGSTRCR
jgi:hypothetical protein